MPHSVSHRFKRLCDTGQVPDGALKSVHWTPEENENLLRLYCEIKSDEEIAKEMEEKLKAAVGSRRGGLSSREVRCING